MVGASATGIQLAEELQASGRPVTLSVGEHVRLPRVYRGKDIFWWLERTGVLDERWDEVDDLVRARNIPSPQLVGTPERRTLDLNALSDQGVRLVGRIAGVVDGKAQISASLRNMCNLADLKMARLLDTILADVYGPRRLLLSGDLPPEVVLANPAFLRAASHVVPPGGTHLSLYAVDVARSPDGRWWIVGDRSDTPAGVGYALEAPQ